MQIEKLSKELKELRKVKSDEYGPFNKKMQAKIVRANNEYKYDSYIDAINYLVQADEIHREDVSELVDAYFPTKGKTDVSI